MYLRETKQQMKTYHRHTDKKNQTKMIPKLDTAQIYKYNKEIETPSLDCKFWPENLKKNFFKEISTCIYV